MIVKVGTGSPPHEHTVIKPLPPQFFNLNNVSIYIFLFFQAFSRRWDMERHLNKSKYGCPANRFGSSPSPSHPGSGGSHSLANSPIQGLQVGPPVGGGASAHHLLAMIPHSTQTNSL